MFNDGNLAFLWVLIDAEEIESIKRRLETESGGVVFKNDRDLVFKSGTTGLRRQPPEILYAQPDMLSGITGYDSVTDE